MHHRIVATETDLPDPVARGSLYQYPIGPAEQMFEFGHCDRRIEAGRALLLRTVRPIFLQASGSSAS